MQDFFDLLAVLAAMWSLGLIELLIQIIHRLSVKAEKKLMQDFRKVYGQD